jgi:hypothetical protein
LPIAFDTVTLLSRAEADKSAALLAKKRRSRRLKPNDVVLIVDREEFTVVQE